jgi:hypothetical protein
LSRAELIAIGLRNALASGPGILKLMDADGKVTSWRNARKLSGRGAYRKPPPARTLKKAVRKSA